MIRLGVSVEGPTEEAFVNDVLEPHLRPRGIHTVAVIVTTRRVVGAANFRGGDVSVEKVTPEIRRLLGSHDYVTTLYDFYGFRRRQAGESVDALEQRLTGSVDSKRFIPYVQRYEFESLLFSDGMAAGQLFNSPALAQAIDAVRTQFGDPELINDSRETAPSRRLDLMFRQQLGREYDKAAFGAFLAVYIGLNVIRQRCARFNTWLTRLESLVPDGR